VETEDDHFRELEHLCLKYSGNPLVGLAAGTGIIWDQDPAGYRRSREFVDHFKIPFSMHLVETEEDDRYAQQTWGMSAIDLLESCGILGPDFIAVHDVNVKDEDIRRFRDFGVKVSHCPIANMILASGTAPVPRFLQEGVTVSLACDGAASNDSQDMLEVMRIAALKHKLVSHDASVVTAEQVLEMATRGGAKALGMERRIGTLEVGKLADMFVWSPNTARSIPVNDPISSLIYSSDSATLKPRSSVERSSWTGAKSKPWTKRPSWRRVKASPKTSSGARAWGTAIGRANTHSASGCGTHRLKVVRPD